MTPTNCSRLDPSAFDANVAFIRQYKPVKACIEMLNHLTEKLELPYNIKHGPKGKFTNKAELVVSSIHRPPKGENTWRWQVVEYLPCNVETRHYSKKRCIDAVRDLFECLDLHAIDLAGP